MYKRGLRLPKKRGFIAPASLFRRYAAYIIDFIMISIVILPLGIILQKQLPPNLGIMQMLEYIQANPQLIPIRASVGLFSAVLTVLYFTYFEYKLQQTPGKMLMKISIIPEKREKLTFSKYLLSNILFAFTLLWILDLLYMIFSPKNQRFMERLTKILVVQRYEAA